MAAAGWAQCRAAREALVKRKLAELSVYLPLFALISLALAHLAPSIALAQGGSLAEAYRIISSKQFVDLTHSFSPLTPVWKGFGPAAFSVAADPETGPAHNLGKCRVRCSFYST